MEVKTVNSDKKTQKVYFCTKKYHDLALTLTVNISGYKQCF